MRKRALRCSGLGLALLLPCLTLPSRALACVVGTGTGASCSESALNACLPGGGSFDGTVTFNCGGAAAITVTSTKIISADTTIDGGSLITISGGNSVGVFSASTGVKFTVQNLTITNGNSADKYGGGIYNGGALTVTNTTFSSNSAHHGGGIFSSGTLAVSNSAFSGNSAGDDGGGIYASGTLTVTNSTFSGNSASHDGGGIYGTATPLTVSNSTFSGNSAQYGGGILSFGTLTVTNSAFSGNSASYDGGGGIYTGGTLTVTNSTFSGNSASYDGGGIFNSDGSTVALTNSTFSGNSGEDGGGVSSYGTLAVTNCTFTGNGVSYGGGGIFNGGALTVTNSTFSGNSAYYGGGISSYGTVTVTNTIVANSASGGNCDGGVTDGGHNIDDGTTCGFTGTGCTGTSGSSFCNTNPVLDPTGLQNNGGPTQTVALCTGPGTPSTGCTGASPGIHGGDENVCSMTTGVAPVDNLDQRGFVRPGTGAANCSIGAFEANSAAPCVVGAGTRASCTESALNACLPGGGSFDGAVTFKCGGAATIIVTSTKTISADTTIDGGSLITISGGNSVGVFSVNVFNVKFTVRNLTVANGNSVGNDGMGGGIYSEGTLTVTNSTFSGNSASNGGGGIFSGGTLTVTNSTFSGTLTVTNSSFSGNSASNGGGGIFNDSGTLTVTNTTFSGNGGDDDGGGISNYSGTVTVTNSTFSGNSAGYDGGAISNYAGRVTVTNTIVVNSASGDNCYGAVTDGGHNIDDGTTCSFTGTGCTSTSGSSFCNTNPVLDPTGLQNNGGPTQTVALCTGPGAPSAGCTGASPGINAGDESVCSTTIGIAPVDNLDQRGFVRPGTGAANCSIGAFEANSAAACVVGTGTAASCTESTLTACLPGGGSFDGAVTFKCGGAATITVTSTKTISADTTIDGGSLITISGGNSVGVFSVNYGAKFTVENLTIANGSGSAYRGIGGILNYGMLTVINTTFSGNSATGGGILNLGTATVSNSTFAGNSGWGAGIYSNGTLTVTNSAFSDNSATYSAGGGIYNDSESTLMVTNTTFSGNSARYGGGGGIYNHGGTLTVSNSTFSGNTALGGGVGGGIGTDSGTLTVSNSTFSGNRASIEGGAIFNANGTTTLVNTIVANSSSGGNCADSVPDGGHNIDDDGSCGFSGTSLSNTNPMLAGLANNGGPTQTIALQAGSPAINAGDESVCAVRPVNNLDQRGYVRPGGGATSCSIGAYEYNSLGPPPFCEGDCNSDRHVTVDEILTMVNIALGNTAVMTCQAGDANHDGHITVDEILTAVNNAMNGCGSGSTPTPNTAGA